MITTSGTSLKREAFGVFVFASEAVFLGSGVVGMFSVLVPPAAWIEPL